MTVDPVLLYYAPLNRTLLVHIVSNRLKVIDVRLAPKPAALEVNAYVDDQPARQLAISLWRGGELWQLVTTRKQLDDRMAYIIAGGLMPGTYTVKVDAVSAVTGKLATRWYIVTLDEGVTESITIDASTKERPPIENSSTASVFVLNFNRKPERSFWWALREARYVEAYPPPGESISWSWDDEEELPTITSGSTADGESLRLILRMPVAPGSYKLIVGGRYVWSGWHYEPITTLATPGGEEYMIYDPSNATAVDYGDPGATYKAYNNSMGQCVYSHWDITDTVGRIVKVDWVLSCRLVLPEQGTYTINMTWVGGMGTFTLKPWHAWLLPDIGSRAPVVWQGELWPGMSFSLSRDESAGNATLDVVRGPLDVVIAYYPMEDTATMPAASVPAATPWSFSTGIRGNAAWTWLTSREDSAYVEFTVTCTEGCYVYVYGMERPAGTGGGVRLIVDDQVRARAGYTTAWQLLRAFAGPSNHTIRVELAYTSVFFAQEGGIDHIVVVANNTITVSGLKPGYRVAIYDSNGNLLAEEQATSDTVVFNAEEMGIYRFPFDATIVVYR